MDNNAALLVKYFDTDTKWTKDIIGGLQLGDHFEYRVSHWVKALLCNAFLIGRAHSQNDTSN